MKLYSRCDRCLAYAEASHVEGIAWKEIGHAPTCRVEPPSGWQVIEGKVLCLTCAERVRDAIRLAVATMPSSDRPKA